MNTLAAMLARWLGRERRPHRRTETAELTTDEPVTAEEDSLPCGCGWFVSSLDLRDGLAVIEHDLMVVEAVLMPC